jgi:Flp pilus assembly protein TadD
MNSLELHQEGLRAFESGDFESASRLFWSGLQLAESSELWNDWATARFRLGDCPVAEQGFRRALDLDQSLAKAAVNLGALLAGTSRYTEAIGYLRCAVKLLEESSVQVEELLQWCKLQAGAAGNPSEVAETQQSQVRPPGTTLLMFPRSHPDR